MKKLILICLSVLVLIGCGKDDNETAEPLINAYATKYMVDLHKAAFYSNFSFNSLEYKNGKVTKRIHGQECILDNSCQDKSVQDQLTIVDDVTYGKNTIIISNRSGTSNRDIRQQEWFLKLKNTNQIEYLLQKLEDSKMYDSLLYEYSSNGKIKQITSYSVYQDQYVKFADKSKTKDFFFDASGNLQKVETRHLLDDGFVIKMIIETFEDYDTAKNPFKELFMFNDTFYRSLSENNFRKYRRQEKDMPNGTSYDTQWISWDIKYSSTDVPLFDKL